MHAHNRRTAGTYTARMSRVLCCHGAHHFLLDGNIFAFSLYIINQIEDGVPVFPTHFWRMTEKDTRRLATFHTTFRTNHASEFGLIKSPMHVTGQETMGTIARGRMWKWLSQVLRMEPTTHARIALTWTSEGRRKKGVFTKNLEESGRRSGRVEECWFLLGECLP